MNKKQKLKSQVSYQEQENILIKSKTPLTKDLTAENTNV